jgi:hypothetical protein
MKQELSVLGMDSAKRVLQGVFPFFRSGFEQSPV